MFGENVFGRGLTYFCVFGGVTSWAVVSTVFVLFFIEGIFVGGPTCFCSLLGSSWAVVSLVFMLGGAQLQPWFCLFLCLFVGGRSRQWSHLFLRLVGDVLGGPKEPSSRDGSRYWP